MNATLRTAYHRSFADLAKLGCIAVVPVLIGCGARTADPALRRSESQARTEAEADRGASERALAIDELGPGVVSNAEGATSTSANREPLTLILTWEGGADLDLVVADPRSRILTPQDVRRPSSDDANGNTIATTGDARGDCTVERRTREEVDLAPDSPTGHYTAYVVHFASCGGVSEPAHARLQLRRGDSDLAAFTFEVRPLERLAVVGFSR